MTTVAKPTQFIKQLEDGSFWIQGELSTPPAGIQGPMIIGAGWMLEIVRVNGGTRTIGLFLAPFGIVEFDIPEFREIGKAEFVGLSRTDNPPHWLRTSTLFDMNQTALPESPKELLGLFARPLPGTPIEAAPEVSALSAKAKRRICETYRESIPISEFARELGVSHAHLTRQFKRDFGFTPISYRHRLRASDATGRLFRGDDILDVGQEVGFNDTSRFYKDFRKITGTSPGKCRL